MRGRAGLKITRRGHDRSRRGRIGSSGAVQGANSYFEGVAQRTRRHAKPLDIYLRPRLGVSAAAALACSSSIRLMSRRMRSWLMRILSGPVLRCLPGLAV